MNWQMDLEYPSIWLTSSRLIWSIYFGGAFSKVTMMSWCVFLMHTTISFIIFHYIFLLCMHMSPSSTSAVYWNHMGSHLKNNAKVPPQKNLIFICLRCDLDSRILKIFPRWFKFAIGAWHLLVQKEHWYSKLEGHENHLRNS